MSFDIQLRRAAGIALISVALVSCGGSDNTAVTPVTMAPTFSVASGPYTSAQTVSIADTTSGAVIYYTTDGTTPGTTVGGSTMQYSSALTISDSTNLVAVALAPGHSVSEANAASYTIGPTATAAGIWVQDAIVNGQSEATVIGIVTAAGQSVFINVTDFSQYAGAVTVTGTTFTAATLDGYTNFPATFADASTSGTGAFAATLGTDSSLVGALTFTSAGGHAYPATWTMTYSTLSLSGSLVSALAGTYKDSQDGVAEDPNTGGTVTISATGVLASSGTTSGCVMSGTISTADPTTDIYEVSYTYSGCAGVWAVLNAVPFTGLAALNAGQGQLIMAANGQSGGNKYGLVTGLNFQ